MGLGTFRPIQTDLIDNHKMHTEHYEISEDTAQKINRAIKLGKRCIAVGTTVVRTLESACNKGVLNAGTGSTQLFIKPGYSFQIVDGLITNFHLPKSSLFVLVSSFLSLETIKSVYTEAIECKYRFYSYGDAMFLLR